jgi:molybdenum cofactor cytidylyltransferase
MGRPKLLLPWADKPVIEHVLDAWNASRVDHVVMVVPAAGDDGQRLAEIGLLAGVDVVVPSVAPEQMKDSVLAALQHITEQISPQPTDAWLLAPADMPRLSAAVIDQLLDTYDPSRPATLVPTCDGRRGHPVLLPFDRAREVAALSADRGVDAIISKGIAVEVPVADAAIAEDLDTPEDFRRLGSASEGV